VKRLSLMVIAGEASGDTLAAELVHALRAALAHFQGRPTPDLQPLYASLEPVFFGAGGPRMAAAGVDLAVDMTAHTVFGIVDVFKNYRRFRRLMGGLVSLAIRRQPDVIICVDFSGFNRRFAHAVKEHVRACQGTFNDWQPKIVQFVSPQVWASRPGRARAMARDFDLVLSIFPFEKAWYARHAPAVQVEFIGHPLLDRYGRTGISQPRAENALPLVALLPGSRPKELKSHLPVIIEAARQILASRPVAFRMILPSARLAQTAQAFVSALPEIQVQVGGLEEALARADVALAKSGTITMECAFFGVPTVLFYKVSWLEFEIARRLVRVDRIGMPNLLAGETVVFPEFLQQEVTPENLARAALEFLNDPVRRQEIKARLARVIASLGEPGASRRAAEAVLKMLGGVPIKLN
jgi:lipid-A-disaccharide synthase